MSAFVDIDEFLQRFDENMVAQLVSDTGEPATDLTDNAVVLLALSDATGEVLSKAEQGGAYTETDLQNLTEHNRNYLNSLISRLAFYRLVQRRNFDLDDYPGVRGVEEQLEQIADGARVFGTSSAISAGRAEASVVSVQRIKEENLFEDHTRLFPVRRFTAKQW